MSPWDGNDLRFLFRKLTCNSFIRDDRMGFFWNVVDHIEVRYIDFMFLTI